METLSELLTLCEWNPLRSICLLIVAWRYQAIFLIKVELSSEAFCSIYLKAVQDVLKNFIHIMS